MGTVWQILILNIHLPYNLTNPFLDIYPRETKTYVHTKAHEWMFTAALSITIQTGNNPNIHI